MSDVTPSDLQQILSENRHPDSMTIDCQSTFDILKTINVADKTVPNVIAEILPVITQAVDLIVSQLSAGGRLIYIGAGTSGRLGILDAVECVPRLVSTMN